VKSSSPEESPQPEEPRTSDVSAPREDPYEGIEDWGDRRVEKQGRPDNNDPIGNAVNRILGLDQDEIDQQTDRLLGRDQHKGGKSK
jgi:hypothetical protein